MKTKKFIRAFSLLEVMIAIAIFFVASYAILGLISSSLDNVRRLQRPSVDASPVLARFAATNSLVEGTYSGNLGDRALAQAMPIHHSHSAKITMVGTAARRKQDSIGVVAPVK